MADADKELALREYITSAGGFVHADISLLAEDPAKGRKVVATKDLPKGTALLKIPTTICFSASPTRPAPTVRPKPFLFHTEPPQGISDPPTPCMTNSRGS
jgi:hypothetical protein